MHSLVSALFITESFWQSTIRIAGPIALAAVASVLCSRAGVLFIAVDGVMLISAFFGIAGTVWSGSIWVGVLLAMVAGSVSALLFGVLSMNLRMGDVVAGLIMHVGALGFTAFLVEQFFKNGATIGSKLLQPLWGPFGGPVGRVLFHQQPLVYLAILAALATEWFLRTRWGLRIRSGGESMRVARAFGFDLLRMRFSVLAVAGALTGLGGATIGLVIVSTFDTNVVNGAGFIGLACVMLGAWRPLGALAASLLFGAAYASQFNLGVSDTAQGWVQLLPYVVTLLALALFWGRTHGPPEEGRGLPDEFR